MENYNTLDPYRAIRIKIIGPLAAAYVPIQKFQCLYDPKQGFAQGTIFEELDLPFMGKGVR